MAAAPRSDTVNPLEQGVYHLYARCVRRAMLCGVDPVTKKDYSYRRKWIIDFMKVLAQLFAIDIAFHAELANHLHNVVRNRPDIVATWSDIEVVRRWLTITHLIKSKDGTIKEICENEILIQSKDPERVEKLRMRLSHPSVFMASLCEHVARRCNREDGVKGHFWEERHGCRNLVDDAAIMVCGVYVDLNQIRAGEAQTPETSEYTSAHDRIEAMEARKELGVAMDDHSVDAKMPDNWLCPFTLVEGLDVSVAESRSSVTNTRVSDKGILPIEFTKYLELLDASGRIVRDGKGSIPDHLAPILERLGIRTEMWTEMIQNFDTMFGRIVGASQRVAKHVEASGHSWIHGQNKCRRAFG
ncbi:MAG: hypothetical protein R3E01_05505 [Pirellulaceae bacterium]